mgnify:CR=1 FL=1
MSTFRLILSFPILSTILILTSCAGSKNLQQSAPDKPQHAFLTLKTALKEGKQGYQWLQITNTSIDSLTLIDPAIIQIEKLEEGEWEKVPVLDCPCGADCLPGPPRMPLAPGKEYTLTWNLYRSWCENVPREKLPVERRELSKPGTYRWVISYMTADREKKIQTERFFLSE